MRLLVRILVNVAAVAAATVLVDGITVGGDTTQEQALVLLGVAVLLALVNALVRPVVRVLTFPLFLLTLGLFTFVVNALMLLLVSWLSERLDLAFRVDGFGSALVGALIISVVSFVLNVVLPDEYER
jgi:putative membrane protein